MEGIGAFLEFPVDFEGQARVEEVINKYNYLIIVTSVITGLVTQNLFSIVIVFGIEVIVLLAIVLPNWPIYRKKPVEWLKIQYEL